MTLLPLPIEVFDSIISYNNECYFTMSICIGGVLIIFYRIYLISNLIYFPKSITDTSVKYILNYYILSYIYFIGCTIIVALFPENWKPLYAWCGSIFENAVILTIGFFVITSAYNLPDIYILNKLLFYIQYNYDGDDDDDDFTKGLLVSGRSSPHTSPRCIL
jgi:hypothetical protein